MTRGRPKLAPGQARSVNITMRLRPATKDALGEAARAGGFSLSEEAERRLAQSFRDDWILTEIRKMIETV